MKTIPLVVGGSPGSCVRFDERSGKWHARVRYRGERPFLGSFECEAAARQAVAMFRREHGQVSQEERVVGYTVVDDEDYDALTNCGRWHLDRNGYVVRGKYSIGIHRVICGLLVGDPLTIDHIDHDKTNNRRSSLRIATHAENLQNRQKQAGTTSRFVGVSFSRDRQKWHAEYRLNGRAFHLGFYESEDEAGAVASEARAVHMPFSKDALLAGQWQKPRAFSKAS